MRDQKVMALRSCFRGVAVVLLGAALASCGGGGDDNDDGPVTPPPVASNQPPASASQGVDGFIAFLKTVVVTKPETSEPLDLTGFSAPATETGDPDPAV